MARAFEKTEHLWQHVAWDMGCEMENISMMFLLLASLIFI
jgi:hypothetical protein